MTGTAIDTLLVGVVLTGLYLLGTRVLRAAIQATALQGAMLAVLPVLVTRGLDPHAFVILVATFVLKVLVIPRLLLRAMSRANVEKEIEPLIGFASSLVVASALVAVAFAFGLRLAVPGEPMSRFLVPCALSTVLLGLLKIVTRTKALSQVVGYVVLENGIYIFGLILVRDLPLLVEMGILLDAFVGVFVMGIVVHHISRAFDNIDTHTMTALRD
jgi:hydrogenase-4 component E